MDISSHGNGTALHMNRLLHLFFVQANKPQLVPVMLFIMLFLFYRTVTILLYYTIGCITF